VPSILTGESFLVNGKGGYEESEGDYSAGGEKNREKHRVGLGMTFQRSRSDGVSLTKIGKPKCKTRRSELRTAGERKSRSGRKWAERIVRSGQANGLERVREGPHGSALRGGYPTRFAKK